jgi:hypothetical protein
MAISLHEWIVEHLESLLDAITGHAIRPIPSYGEAPLQRTLE